MSKVFETAKWIFADVDGKVVDRYFRYETAFNVKDASLVTLNIAAYLDAAVYVNGTFVNSGIFPDYEPYPVYDTLDLSAYVKAGTNTLTVVQYVSGAVFSASTEGISGVIFEVTENGLPVLASDETVPSCEDTRYLAKAEVISGQLGFNFEYDANNTPTAFTPSVSVVKSRAFRPRPIEKLVVGAPVAGKITAQGVFKEYDASMPKSNRLQKAYLSMRDASMWKTGADGSRSYDITSEADADGAYFTVDLGGETAGYLTFDIDVPEPCEILIGYGEHLDDLRPRTIIGSRNFAFRYVAKAGRNTFSHPFRRLGGRYLQFHIYARTATVYTASVCPTDYPLTSLDTPMPDRFWKHITQIGEKTLRMCMHEHYEDCPWREQSLYAMDSRVQILCGYYAFGETRFPRASLELMSHSYRERDGLLELCAPGNCGVDIPCFTAVYVREVLEYSMYSKDLSLAREVLPVLYKIVDGFAARIDETGLIPLYTGKESWNFYEWRDGLNGQNVWRDPYDGDVKLYEAPLAAFVSDSLRCFGCILDLVGVSGGEKYAGMAKKLGKAAHEAFFDEKTGAYITRKGETSPRHALTQAMMLFCDAVPEDKKNSVKAALTSGDLIPVSVSMTIYAYEALLCDGGTYGAYVLDDMERIWGRMLRAGADTFWETEEGANDFSMAGSMCHGWSAVPIYILGRYYKKGETYTF